MTHSPTHERKALLKWIAEGFHDTARIEEDHEPCDISADQLLRCFMIPTMYTNVMPGPACEQVATELGYDGDAREMTYASRPVLCSFNDWPGRRPERGTSRVLAVDE